MAPGAGLKPPEEFFDDTELIFDSIFRDKTDTHDSGYSTSDAETSVEPEELTGPVRVYRSDGDM